MIKQAEKEYLPVEIEKRVREFWKKTKSSNKTRQLRASGKDFYFVDGPPYTTGSIHLGTALNKTIKDVMVRYWRMKGYNIRDQPGYDMHGLPIEVQVEKTLGITNKKEIEDFGIEKFISTCKEFSSSLAKKMTEQFSDLGVWLDWDRPYMTLDEAYIESAWWTIKKAHERGLLVESMRALTWCSRCETALAEAEIEYWDESDASIYVHFPLVSREGESILIWTTTPWTIPANLAVAIHPDFTYALVKFQRDGREFKSWMLESNIEKVMTEGDIQQCDLLTRLKGKELVGWEYTHPLTETIPYQREVSGEWVHKVLPSTIVTEEYAGVVHIAPGHGPEDFEIGQTHNLPPFSPVDESGKFSQNAGAYAGMHVKEANKVILDDLVKTGRLFVSGSLTHRYGHCWRCRSPIIYRLTTQWFLKVSQVKEKMLEEVARVRWTPEWAGSSRQREWTMNLRDWCISRQRYWGTPLPVWRCGNCKEIRVVGTMEELKDGENFQPGIDPHRPAIDSVTFKCPKCSGTQSRVGDILDVWFDAGICSWAQLRYPREEEEFKKWWPVDFITEAHDQTRGWFNSQLAASVIAFNQSPYKSVLMHGWMLGTDGQAMSKSLGNYVSPQEVIEKYGVDSLRLYLLKTKAPWEDLAFNWEEVKNAHRSLNILWNVYKFAALYMNMDDFDPQAHSLDSLIKHLKPEDKWLLSKIERLKMTLDRDMESFNLHKACRALEEFILNDLSRWYVRLVRDRTWIEGDDKDKLAAYKTLHEAMSALCRLLAPICPYISEAIYQNLDGRFLTVHMCAWPKVNEDLINGDLEVSMATVQELVELVSQARQEAHMKLRWPIAQIVFEEPTETARHAVTILKDVFLNQANARDANILEHEQHFDGLKLHLKPEPEAISKVYKASWSKIVTMLATRNPIEVQKALAVGEYKLGINGQILKIQPHMVSFDRETPEGIKVIHTQHGVMYVDMRITPEVEAEGYAREIIRRVQQMRKDIDLPVDDYVRTSMKIRPELVELIDSWRSHIASETRSRVFNVGQTEVSEEYTVSWNVEGETILLGITPLHMGEAIAQFTKIEGITQTKATTLFEAGYKTLESLNQATPAELAMIEGVEETDARRIKEFVSRPLEVEPPSCPTCETRVRILKGRCWRCGEPLEEEMPPIEEAPPTEVVPPVEAAPPKEAGPAVEATPEIEPEIPTEVAPEDVVPCPNCKAPMKKGIGTCPTCGVTIEKEPVMELPKVEETLPQITEAPVEPPPALPTPATPQVTLKESSTYLVKEAHPEEAYSIFKTALTTGRRGFCVTRVFPQKIKEKYGLDNIPVIWLSNIGKEESVRPKDLEKLSLLLEQFVTKEAGLILLDGIEYLITNNNFLTVLRLVQSLRDQVAMNKATLLLSVNPSTLDSHQLNLLEREVDGVVDLTVALD